MTRQAPWSVKGMSQQAREAAKDLARREGMPIGEWLSGLITEVDGARSPAGSPTRATPVEETRRYAQPVFDPTYARGEAAGLQPFPGVTTEQAHASAAGQEQSRLVEVLETLTRRLDPMTGVAPVMPLAANLHSGPSHAALERALSELANHVESRDRQTSRTIGQLDAGLSEIQQTQDALAERLRRMEASNPEHKSLAALRSLEGALAQLDRDMRALQGGGDSPATGSRVDTLERAQAATLERIDSVHGSVQQSVSALASASESLADRVLDLEKAQDEADKSIGARVDQLETLARQGLEETDRGLGLLGQRIAATEAIAQQVNERFAEAMVDLSARLAALEDAGQGGVSGPQLADVMGEVGRIDARVAALDTRMTGELAEAREALRGEVSGTLAAGMDARFADLARALASRLDAAEQSSTATMERIGAEVARIATTLDERVTSLEAVPERSDNAMAFKLEVARISRAIDERLTQIEERSVGSPEETGRKIDALGQALETRINGIEQRSVEAARGAANAASQEMQDLIRRLETRQSEAADALSRRIAEAEERAERRMEDRFRSVEKEIAAAEDRAKAVAAPLHRGFETLLDRIDSMETGEVAGFAETVSPPDYRVGFAAGPESIAPATQAGNWKGGFASPFPGDPVVADGPSGTGGRLAAFEAPGNPLDDPAGLFDDPLLIEDPAHLDPFGAESRDVGADGSGLDDSDIEVWPMDDVAPMQTGRQSGADYLSNARRAAIEAAQQEASAREAGKKPKAGRSKAAAKPEAKATKSAKGKPESAQTGPKAGLSPVGMVAAAGLVLTAGVAGYNYLTGTSAQDEMPEALARAESQPAAATVGAAGAAAVPTPAAAPLPAPPVGLPAGTDTMPATEAATSGPLDGAQAARPPAVAPQTAPKAAAEPPRVRPGAPSPQLERLSREEAARAQAARARAAQGTQARPSATAQPSARPARPVRDSAAAPSTGTPRIASSASERPARAQAARADAGAILTQARQRRQAGDAAGAAALMRQAADAGSVAAQNELAGMYERGEGVPRDLAQARRLTERAAAAGSRRAQHNLGVYYTEGEAAARDYNRAQESFTAAARRGNTDSQYNLGAMAEQGLGREASRADAAYWYGVAGRGGDQEAARQAERVRAQLSPEERAQVDARVTGFQPEPSADD
jgi:localization factor PodJL